MHRFQISDTPEQEDGRVIAQDWMTVGDDLLDAMDSFRADLDAQSEASA